MPKVRARHWIVANKCDLEGFESRPGEIPVSALTGEGIEALKVSAINLLAPGGESHGGFITSVRHENLLVGGAVVMLEKARAR